MPTTVKEHIADAQATYPELFQRAANALASDDQQQIQKVACDAMGMGHPGLHPLEIQLAYNMIAHNNFETPTVSMGGVAYLTEENWPIHAKAVGLLLFASRQAVKAEDPLWAIQAATRAFNIPRTKDFKTAAAIHLLDVAHHFHKITHNMFIVMDATAPLLQTELMPTSATPLAALASDVQNCRMSGAPSPLNGNIYPTLRAEYMRDPAVQRAFSSPRLD